MLAASGSGPTIGRIASAVGFAEGVAAGNQRNRLFVVHRHAAERLANILGCGNGIRIAIGPFRIHVDQTHLHGSERILRSRSPL